MNIAAACIVLSIIVLRKFFLYKIPSFVFAISWGLAFLRLLVPYDICTNYNFYNAFFYIIENFLDVSLNTSIFSNFTTFVVQVLQNKLFLFVLLAIWLSGILYVGKAFVADFLETIKLRQTSIPMESEGEIYETLEFYGLSKKYLLCENENIASPIACGILKPMIIFPKGFCHTHSEIFEQALLHEYMHLKYYHQVIQYFLILVVIINWFNPFVWIMYHYINRDMEVACDRGALKLLGDEYREIYALQLVHMVDKDYRERPNQVVFYNSFSKFVLKERIVAIMRFKKFSIAAVVVSTLLPLGTVSAFGASPNYMFGSDFQSGKYEIAVNTSTNSNVFTNSSQTDETLLWEQLAPYATDIDSRAASSLKIIGYKIVYSSLDDMKKSITITTKKDGYTYKGTLYLDRMEMDGSKCIAYYDGTLYRQ